jgi:hypothetical protein
MLMGEMPKRTHAYGTCSQCKEFGVWVWDREYSGWRCIKCYKITNDKFLAKTLTPKE